MLTLEERIIEVKTVDLASNRPLRRCSTLNKTELTNLIMDESRFSAVNLDWPLRVRTAGS